MRKAFLLPAAAILSGAAGFALRLWGLSSAFETEGDLPLVPIPGAPATWALIVFSVLIAAALFLLCRGRHRTFPGGYDGAFAAKGNTLYITAVVLAALLLLLSGVLQLLGLPEAYQTALGTEGINPVTATVPKVLLAVMTVGSFFCVLLVGKNNYRGEGRGKNSLPLLIPAYTACVWLLAAYQTREGDPVRLNYIYELLAIVAILLGLYFTSGFSFEKGKTTPALFFSLLGVYFSIVTLADSRALSHTLLFGFAILYLTAGSAALLSNDGRERMCPVRKETIENETEGHPDE